MTEASWFDIRGKKALVTGGAGGIGRSIALALAEAGADVAIVDRDEALAKKTAAAVKALGRDSIAVKCDVADGDSVKAMMAAVVRQFGRLDIAVNNAGIYRHSLDESQPKEEWDQVVGINFTGVWLCAQAEMQQMIQQMPTEGKIINIGSIGSIRAVSNASYDGAKAGVVHMSRVLAARWGTYNINVNCVSPGYVGMVFGQSRPPEERAKLRELTPLGYVMRPKDLHGAVLFLASRASDFVTGQNIVIDGGHTLSTWMQPLQRNRPPRVDEAGELSDD